MPETRQPNTDIRDFTPPGLPPVPDLAGMQKTSYARLLETGSERGLGRLLREAFAGAGTPLEHLRFELVQDPFSPDDCVRFGRTYASTLCVHLARNDGTDIVSEGIPLPAMTTRGTFIIEGTEKVIVGCLQALEDCRENDLATRRLLLIGEQLQQALASPIAEDIAEIAQGNEITFCHVTKTIRDFFAKGPHVKKADLRNPVTLASQLRLVVQTGVNRQPGYTARCPHPTHFGRLGLLETPEGDRIGINLTTALFATQDEEGQIMTPFAEAKCPENVVELPPKEDAKYTIGDLADATVTSRYAGGILARAGDDLHCVPKDTVDLKPVHPQQPLGVSSALIPCMAHDDANRALMGANMQKQAMPLLIPDAPLVQTGLEQQVIRDMQSGPDWCSDKGTLALGRNLLVAFMCWEGYNFEDGIVVSDDVTKRGLLDTVQTREYTVAIREQDKELLTEAGTIEEGAVVSAGAVLIGKARVRADGTTEDTSIRAPYGYCGTAVNVEHHRKANCAPLAEGVTDFVRVRLESPRPLQVGDKLCTRHGAKGVVTKIVPADEMPLLPDGRRVQVLINPLGVPSRMNIGAVIETHMGLAAHDLGCTVITPGFCGASIEDTEALLEETNLPKSGMFRLQDGKTGRLFDQETTAGYLYMLRLDHMVADRRQQRATGPYDPDTCQPVSGRRNGGGQHIGIMETWALQGHRASHILREMLTIKSDDVTPRTQVYDALVTGTPLPAPTVPESVKRLISQLRGLCLDLQLHDDSGAVIDPLSPEASTASAESATLRFADADSILRWSEGEVTFREQIIDMPGHIALTTPVKHAWRSLAPDLETSLPEITVLPVLPRKLRSGSRLDAHYVTVLEANRACREANPAPQSVEELQRAVDHLLNGMTRLLYGKKGWITSALSGKTVDYSARSVICPGPDLAYDTCALPIPMAATLFEPFAVGKMLAGLSQDMVLGCYYATCGTFRDGENARRFDSANGIKEEHEAGTLGIHESVILLDRKTTVGEALFNATLPTDSKWIAGPVGKPELWALQNQVWHDAGADSAARLADDLMRFGFHHATLSGLSFGKDILEQVSSYDRRLAAGWNRARRIIADAEGETDHHSACSELATHWMAVVRGMEEAALKELGKSRGGLNSLYLMLASRARCNQNQARQHIAMRGLMTRPDSRIMRSPITTNFLKGHTPLEYLASTYGARRGLADTSLKTSDVGTLFKRIMGAVQDVVVTAQDCGSSTGLLKTPLRNRSGEWYTLAERIIGRALAGDVRHPESGDELFPADHVLSAQDVATLTGVGMEEVIVRSPITCDATEGVCATCMGVDLTTWELPAVGQPVGVVAAQSIGEPGTQLTMRTFHVAVPPKCEPETRRSVRRDILGGLPRLRQLLEAWNGMGNDNTIERDAVHDMLESDGAGAVTEYFLAELQKVYREQGVHIDDRHFEIVLAEMLQNGLQGVSQVAASSPDFLVSGSSYGGIPALARSAAAGTQIRLSSVRSCTAFARLMP